MWWEFFLCPQEVASIPVFLTRGANALTSSLIFINIHQQCSALWKLWYSESYGTSQSFF